MKNYSYGVFGNEQHFPIPTSKEKVPCGPKNKDYKINNFLKTL